MRNICISIQLVVASLCLLAGMCIYLLFRSRQHLGFIVLDSIGLTSAIDYIRSSAQGVEATEFVRFCLPDGLWTTSYVLFSDYFNRNEKLKLRLLWVSAIPMIGCVSEMLQFCGLLLGVFDVLDIVCYALPLVAYYIIMVIKTNKWINH